MHIASQHGIEVVEDACKGIGASLRGRKAGTFGRINAYSMHPLKSLNVMDDGEMVVTNDESLACWLRKYRNYGLADRDHIEFWGVNMRLQLLQAIVSSHELDDLQIVFEKRNWNAARLDRGLKPLAPDVVLPPRPSGFIETQALYMGLFEKRDQLLIHLQNHEIEAKVHYPLPLHVQPAARSLNYSFGTFPVAEWQASHLIMLPVHQFKEWNKLTLWWKQWETFTSKPAPNMLMRAFSPTGYPMRLQIHTTSLSQPKRILAPRGCLVGSRFIDEQLVTRSPRPKVCVTHATID